GFRCFEDLSIEGLERVNLIAGKNGLGKTSLLEALWLHCGASNPILALRIRVFRGYSPKVKLAFGVGDSPPWHSLFADFDLGRTVRIEGTEGPEAPVSRKLTVATVREIEELRGVPGLERVVPDERHDNTALAPRVLRYLHETGNERDTFYLILDPENARVAPVAPSVPMQAIFNYAGRPFAREEIVERFGRAEKNGDEGEAVAALKIVEPRIKRLATIVELGQPMLCADIGIGTLVPLPAMGGGVGRLADLVLAIREARNGVVLADELENGLHYSVLEKVWKAVGEAARKFNVQIFATTHSFECIAAAHRAFSESETYDFRLHRLERIKGAIKAVSYEQDTLQAAIETGMEVR
ncbi:MAG: AAA family ATPase, partial [Planctomycetota bacterium]